MAAFWGLVLIEDGHPSLFCPQGLKTVVSYYYHRPFKGYCWIGISTLIMNSFNQIVHKMYLLLNKRYTQIDLKTGLAKRSQFTFLFSKKFRKYFILLPAFYLIMWLMKSPKSFEKIAILKIWQLVFFLGVKTYFGILPLKWCIFRHGKNWFSQIFPCNSYWSH